jgi:hypothetical protein
MARRPRVPLLLALLLCVAGIAHATETFDYVVDRFEADGNVNGPFDGTVDVVDEFDDATLAPWFIRRGTASESGGLLHVQSPGLAVNFPGIFPVPFEASAAGVDNRLHVGDGDAVLRVVLGSPQAIGANDTISFDLSTVAEGALYYTGIVLSNFNASLAPRFTPTFPVGFAASSHFERLGIPLESLGQRHSISPAAVTGPIVLELRYDDTTHEVTPAVSIDGGATYEFVFDPFGVESDTGDVTVQVAGTAYEGACPAAQKIRTATFSGMGADPGKQKIKLRIMYPSDALTSGAIDPLRLILTDLGAGGATLYDITLPDGVTAFQHACDPRDRRTSTGYINKSNALPPDCVPGSAQGFQKLKMRWTGVNDFRVQIKNTTVAAVVGPIRATIYDGTGPVNECDGWVGDAPCLPHGRSVRCANP